MSPRLKELPRTLKCIHTMFAALDAISCSTSLSILYIAKLPENLRLWSLPLVGENLDIGKNVQANVLIQRPADSLGRDQETPENHPLIVMLEFFYRLVMP